MNINNPQDPEIAKALAQTAAHLLLKRTLRVVATRMKTGAKAVSHAASVDDGSFGRDPEITDATAEALIDLRNTIDAGLDDLATMESYWQSLPWSTHIGRPDPRKVRAAATPQDQIEKAITPDKEGSGVKVECQCPNCRIGRAFDQAMDRMIPGLSEALRESRMAREEAAANGEAPAPAQAPEEQAIVSGPGPDHDPDFVAAKTVEKFDYVNDVRTKLTPGVATVQHVVGGEPVLWITAVDGTRVAVPRAKLREVAEVFAVLSGGSVVGVAPASGNSAKG